MHPFDPETMAAIEKEVARHRLTGEGWQLRAGFDQDGGPYVEAIGPTRRFRLFVTGGGGVGVVLRNLALTARINGADAGRLEPSEN